MFVTVAFNVPCNNEDTVLFTLLDTITTWFICFSAKSDLYKVIKRSSLSFLFPDKLCSSYRLASTPLCFFLNVRLCT